MTFIIEPRVRPVGFDGNERRAARRQRVLKGATLSFNKGYSAFECIVRNQSETGARLSLGETFALPKTFRLAIAGDEVARVARIAWRKPNEIGVAFGTASSQDR